MSHGPRPPDGPPAERGGQVAVGVWEAFDEPVEAESAQVIGHHAGGDGGRIAAQHFGDQGA